MPFVQAKCPECGGILAVDNDQKAAICQFCGKPYIVEEAVNNYITNNITNHNYGAGAVVNIYEDTSKDFVIEAGVLKEYHGSSADVVIPNSVVELSEKCFENSNIKSVSLPDSITTISYGAFYHCGSLKSVKIPNSVTSIGAHAFTLCTNLTSITIPESVKVINEAAFFGCGFISLTIPNSVTTIKSNAFEGCRNLTSVTIADSVTSIGNGAFSRCTNLKDVVISADLLLKSSSAFSENLYKELKKKYDVCRYCGGEFKGMFTKKCSKCGKPKDF